MPQAIVDPDELRQFAAALRRMQQTLRDELSHVQHQLETLGSTWRDQEHARFAESFSEHTRGLSKLAEESEAYIRYLLRKAEQIDTYLQS